MKEQAHVNLVGSWWGVIFASLWAFCFGAIWGAAALILQPVKLVDHLTASDKSLERTFVQGDAAGGGEWQDKLQRFLAARGDVQITEGEINQFIKNSVAAKQVVPSVAIYSKKLQLGVLSYPEWIKYPLCIQTVGVFKQGNDGFYYSPEKTYVGALPLPAFMSEPLVGVVLNRIFEKEVRFGKAWKQLAHADIGHRSLDFTWNE